MAIRILYYSWETSYYDTQDMLKNAGVEYKKIIGSVGNGLKDCSVIDAMESELINNSYDFIFSYDFFPNISELARKYEIKYISWIYDCPHYTLYSKSVSSKYNYFFIFDKSIEDILKFRGAEHIYNMPLGVNTIRLNRLLGQDIRHDDFVATGTSSS